MSTSRRRRSSGSRSRPWRSGRCRSSGSRWSRAWRSRADSSGDARAVRRVVRPQAGCCRLWASAVRQRAVDGIRRCSRSTWPGFRSSGSRSSASRSSGSCWRTRRSSASRSSASTSSLADQAHPDQAHHDERSPIKRISDQAHRDERVADQAHRARGLSPASLDAVVDCSGAFDCARTGSDARGRPQRQCGARVGPARGSRPRLGARRLIDEPSVLGRRALARPAHARSRIWPTASMTRGRSPTCWSVSRPGPRCRGRTRSSPSLGLETLDSGRGGNRPRRGELPAPGRPTGRARPPLSATLGGDLRYVEGSATLTGPSSFPSGAVTRGPERPGRHLPNLPANAPPGSYRLNFDVRSGLGAGSFPVQR